MHEIHTPKLLTSFMDETLKSNNNFADQIIHKPFLQGLFINIKDLKVLTSYIPPFMLKSTRFTIFISTVTKSIKLKRKLQICDFKTSCNLTV